MSAGVKGWKMAGAVVASAALLGGGWRIYRLRDRDGMSYLKTAAARRGSIEELIETTGNVAPLNRVELKPPVAGRIEKLLVEEGAHVRAGQTVAWMSSTDRAAIMDAARAQGPSTLKKWQDAYKATPVIAPISGVIILKNVVVGQTVEPATVVYAMSDRLIVIANVEESDIGKVKLGQAARISLDSYPDKIVAGKVFQILSEGVNVQNVISYPVKIDPIQAPPFFRAQMTANISIVVREVADAVLAPVAAVHAGKKGGWYVFVPAPEGPRKRAVKVGIEGSENAQILSGLSEGDLVVTSAVRYVPQEGAQTSPLAFGRRKKKNQKNGG